MQDPTASVNILGHAGDPIRSFTDWEAYAMPPARKLKHWKQGRSAFELGRIWTAAGQPIVPPELAAILQAHPATRSLAIQRGVTELETPLPFGNGGPRCHDLALLARSKESSALISIEAKADESFGGAVAEELAKASRRPRSRFPSRLNWLSLSLLGLPAFQESPSKGLSPAIASLPYQLFPAVAGTLLEAARQQANAAIFIVHEFRTPLTAYEKIRRNSRALDEFLRSLFKSDPAWNDHRGLIQGQLVGPLRIPEPPSATLQPTLPVVPLYVGKIQTNLLS
jgi:hypothetical protein